MFAVALALLEAVGAKVKTSINVTSEMLPSEWHRCSTRVTGNCACESQNHNQNDIKDVIFQMKSKTSDIVFCQKCGKTRRFLQPHGLCKK